MLPVGVDTLLRTLRRRAPLDREPVQVIGIDGRAWHRRQRYGTLIGDLERRQVVDLLPDREPATVRAWLSLHPEVNIVARDRAGAIADAAPQPVHVADCGHLMENASAAFLPAVRSVKGAIRRALGCRRWRARPAAHREECLQYEG
jgi:transposase